MSAAFGPNLPRRSVLRAGVAGAAFFAAQGKSLAACSLGAIADLRGDVDERRVALVVANKNYANAKLLPNTVNDAQLIVSKLCGLNFDVTFEADVPYGRMTDLLVKFRRNKARSSAVSILYYAGHAVELNGINYIAPIDADFEDYAEFEYKAIESSKLLRAVDSSGRLRIVILDSCRDNPFPPEVVTDGEYYVKNNLEGLAAIDTTSDLVILYSAAPGKRAEDGVEGGNSPFAIAFSEEITKPQNLSTVFSSIRDKVRQSTGNKQSPFIQASIGADAFLLMKNVATNAVVVDVRVGNQQDYGEDEFQDILAGAETEFRFGYEIARSLDGKKNEIIPNLEYFTSRREDGFATEFVDMQGYFSPAEGTVWSIAYPIVDVIAKKNVSSTVVISEIVFDVDVSTPDKTPYVQIVSGSDEFCTLYFVNEGWSSVKEIEIAFDVLGLTLDENIAEKFYSLPIGRDFRYSAVVPGFRNFRSYDFAEMIRGGLSDFHYYEHSFHNYPYEFVQGGKVDLNKVNFAGAKVLDGAPDGYASWLEANPLVTDSSQRYHDFASVGLWIGGRMTVHSVHDDIAPEIVRFVAPLPIYAPDGLGGGAINFDMKEPIKLKTEGKRYQKRIPVSFELDEKDPTFRGLFPLVAEETSKHSIDISLVGDGGQVLVNLGRFDVHIIVPKISKMYASK